MASVSEPESVSTTPGYSRSYRPHGAGGWWLAILAAVFFILGLALGGGGVWLAWLGGSFYYAIAGLGLIVSAYFIYRREMAGFWIYTATWVFTIAWALWEVGLSGWPLVPRLVAPTVLMVVLLISLPAFRRAPKRQTARGRAAYTMLLAGALVASLAIHLSPIPARAQAQDSTSATESPASESNAAGDATAPAQTPATVPGTAEATTPSDGAITAAVPAESTDPAAMPAADNDTPGSDTADTMDPAAMPAADNDTPGSDTMPSGDQQTSGDAADTTTIAATGTRVSTKPAEMEKAGKDWPQYGGTFAAQRYSPLDQINTDTVGDLKQVWLAHTGDMPTEKTKGEYSPENTPVEVNGHLYVCSAMDILISYDAATGKEEWRHDPKVSPDAIPYGATCRGVAYYKSPNATAGAPCAARIVAGTLDARLIEVDAATGESCANFGENGQVDLNKGIGKTVPGWYAVTAPPAIVRGVIVTGAQVKDGQAEDAPSGVIRGYDAVTGKLAWAWDMGHPDRLGAPTGDEVYTRGTPNMWTAAAADEELGYVYLPMGNSSVDYYGGNRKDFENKYSSSLVAIDVTTGKPVWTFQTVHYDLWDYDLGSQPTLVDFPTDGGTVPAIILPSKQGEIYVLNRKTGESLFPVETKDVPQNGVEPENLSKTQPFSGYATLAKPRLKESDMWGATPLDQLMCRIEFRSAVYKGEYTAPEVDKHYVEYPGYNGGSDWGSVAIDPVNGVLVANYNDVPNYNKLIPREKANEMGIEPITKGGNKPKAEGAGDAQAGSPYAIDVNAGWRNPVTGIPCSAPPYGWIRAIDLKTGDTLWDHPFGTAENNGPFGLHSHLPFRIGTPNNGGPLVTAGGLIFVAATTDQKFRAIDIKTGKTVWETHLPAGGQANPMTYEVDGKQYVVLVPGGHHFMETPIGDEVIAYALPDQG